VKRETGGLDAHEPSAPAELEQLARKRARGRHHIMWLVLPIIPMWLGQQLGAALFTTLSTENPTLLLILGAPNRVLIVAAADAQDWLAQGVLMPTIWFAVLGTARLLLPDPFFYAIGEGYGEQAIAWMERRTTSLGQMLRELERLFVRWGWVLVLILPNTYVCLLAGAARMRKSWFWTLNVVGTIGRVLLMWFIGQAFQDTIDTILNFLREYRLPLFVISVLLVGWTVSREWRSGSTEVQQLLDLEHELEGDLDRRLEAEAHAGAPDTAAPAATAETAAEADEQP
jgi:membrane protein DedA with SNARE-associated domain